MRTSHFVFTSLLAAIAYADYIEIWVFFARVNNTFMPLLYDVYSEKDFNNNSVSVTNINAVSVGNTNAGSKGINHAFYYGNISAVSGFTVKDNYAISAGDCTVDDVVSSENLFKIGPPICKIKLKVNIDLRVLNSITYSCPSTHGRSVITNTMLSENCSNVEIYFFNDHKQTRIDVEKPSRVEPKKIPFSFLVKVNNTFWALGPRIAPHNRTRNGVEYSQMCYGSGTGSSTKFEMIDNSAISLDPVNYGYIGLYKKKLSFGPNIPKNDLQLDENWKLNNADYYSCTMDNVQCITTDKLNSHCFPVDVYLSPNVTQSTNAMKHFAKNEVMENSENDVNWKPSSENTVVSPNKSQVISASEQDFPSVSQDSPYVFYAKLNSTTHILSGKIDHAYSDTFSVLFYYASPLFAPPIHFRLEENQYAISMNTTTDGYFGLRGSVFFFGPGITKYKLNIGSDGKLMNQPFYSCISPTSGGYVITIKTINYYCDKVEIYLKQLEPKTEKKTRKPVEPFPGPN